MDPDQEEALQLLNRYLAAMRSWEERVAASADFALPCDSPAFIATRDAFKAELDRLHEAYCQPCEWTDHFCVSTPSVFDLDIAGVVRKSRNWFVVHSAHRSLPWRFQFDVRRVAGHWKVVMMWQTLPEAGKRSKCFF